MHEIVFYCPCEQAEVLSDHLLEAGALAVTLEDADRNTPHEHALFGEPGAELESVKWEHNQVIGLFSDSTDALQMAEQMMALLSENGENQDMALRWETREVPDTDWVRATQAQFAPIHIAQRIHIIPSWHQPGSLLNSFSIKNAHQPIEIELDPGLAFGTGSHPTTHLCLEWLEAQLPPSATVLDYGCGSGILAIAACKLGATKVVAVDIDEQAVQVAQDNAIINQVKIQTVLPDKLGRTSYQIVMANILSNPLKMLAPLLSNRVEDGGYLILSGILASQAQEVMAVYAPWLALSIWRVREGWVCLHGKKAFL